MILYDLRCEEGHQFEAWFRDSATYDALVTGHEVECPFCASANVSKAPMAPRLARRGLAGTGRSSDGAPDSAGSRNGSAGGAALAPSITSANRAKTAETRAAEVAQQILKAVSRLRRHVEDNCDYVGDRFADEAKAIHDGDAEERGIYGEATEEQVADLNEEGVEVYRLPPLPRRDG